MYLASLKVLEVEMSQFVQFVRMQKFDRQIAEHQLGEPLLCAAYEWSTAFVGCLSGAIAVLHRDVEVSCAWLGV